MRNVLRSNFTILVSLSQPPTRPILLRPNVYTAVSDTASTIVGGSSLRLVKILPPTADPTTAPTPTKSLPPMRLPAAMP